MERQTGQLLVTFPWGTRAPFDDFDWAERGVVVTRPPGETFREAFGRMMRQEVNEAKREVTEAIRREYGVLPPHLEEELWMRRSTTAPDSDRNGT